MQQHHNGGGILGRCQHHPPYHLHLLSAVAAARDKSDEVAKCGSQSDEVRRRIMTDEGQDSRRRYCCRYLSSTASDCAQRVRGMWWRPGQETLLDVHEGGGSGIEGWFYILAVGSDVLRSMYVGINTLMAFGVLVSKKYSLCFVLFFFLWWLKILFLLMTICIYFFYLM